MFTHIKLLLTHQSMAACLAMLEDTKSLLLGNASAQRVLCVPTYQQHPEWTLHTQQPFAGLHQSPVLYLVAKKWTANDLHLS
jgi:hypothetical protein